MNEPKYEPGPWQVKKSIRQQLRPFYVVRPVEDGTWSSPHWEQLRAAEGGIASFETSDEARAAIAAATGES